jgi:hypothetical protein
MVRIFHALECLFLEEVKGTYGMEVSGGSSRMTAAPETYSPVSIDV